MKDGYVEWPAPGVSATPLQVAGRCYSWRDGVWKETDASESISPSRPPIRVFRFLGDAWQCPKDAAACFARSGDDGRNPVVIVSGYEGREATGNDTLCDLVNASRVEAIRLSTWAEWFDLTLAAAAHEYLMASLRAGRTYMVTECDPATDNALLFVSNALDAAVVSIARAYSAQDASGDCFCHRDAALDAYLENVRLDIVARLRGERGTIALPDVRA